MALMAEEEDGAGAGAAATQSRICSASCGALLLYLRVRRGGGWVRCRRGRVQRERRGKRTHQEPACVAGRQVGLDMRKRGEDVTGLMRMQWEWRECWRRRRAAWSSGCTLRQWQKIGPRSKLKCDGECQWCCRRP